MSKRMENRRVLTIYGIFIGVIVIVQLLSRGFGRFPTFITPVNILNILQQVGASGIVAAGMTLIMISGCIDLSVGMLASLVSIVTALGITKWQIGTGPAVLIGIIAAVALSSLMGFIVSRTKVESFIITLGGMIAFQGLALLLSGSREVIIQGELDFLKTNIIAGLRDPFTGLKLVIPLYVILFFLILVAVWLLLTYTKLGRRIYAVGSNPEAAFLSGINVRNIRVIVYSLSGFLVGIAGIVLLARINVGIITLGQGLEIDTIAMVVIGGTALSGGRGNTWGTLIGVLFLGSIGNAMNMLRLPPEVQFLAKGIIVILAVIAADLSIAIRSVMKSLIKTKQLEGELK